jgi:hypothetical protein
LEKPAHIEGFASPGYGYVTNRMGTSLQGDPRDLALRAALEGSR